MNRVGLIEINCRIFFTQPYRKKNSKGSVGVFRKDNCSNCILDIVMNAGEPCFHFVLTSKCFTQNLFYGYDYYDHPLHKCFPAYQFPNPLVG